MNEIFIGVFTPHCRIELYRLIPDAGIDRLGLQRQALTSRGHRGSASYRERQVKQYGKPHELWTWRPSSGADRHGLLLLWLRA